MKSESQDEGEPALQRVRIAPKGRLWVVEPIEAGEPLTAEVVWQTRDEVRTGRLWAGGTTMGGRQALHRLIDDLPEQDLSVAIRVLEALRATSDPVLRALMSAPLDDEPDEDDADGGLSEARREAREGKGLSHDEVKRELGLG